ncbi:MAG: hypothetical protein H6Q04_1706 [Acidobacteria bacterium]|jgi:hypothetical protein|nr:hypothetical protein [Acidobacteriota bacterium]
MLKFDSKPPKSPRFGTALTALVIFVIAIAAILFYARHQKATQPGAAGQISVPDMLRPGDTNFEYYKKYIRIDNVRAALGISFNKARVAFISGIITNDGDRKVEAIELRITLFDAWGKFSKDRTTTPVRPDAMPKRPMEPLEQRAFSVGIESVEQYWDPKKVEIEITGLKYR